MAGLAAAYRLSSAGLAVQVLEARARVGGRLMTVEPGSPSGGSFDLGGTWHWAADTEVAMLAESLGLIAFPQFDAGLGLHEDPGQARPLPVDLAGAEAAPVRLDGGCQALAQGLADRLAGDAVALGVSAVAVERRGSSLAVTTAADDGLGSVMADFAVVAMPPRLVLQNIAFDPPLPDDLVAVMAATPTWMAGTVKCVAIYERPFWREAGFSGSAFSHVGPLHELHDASGRSGVPAAIWGLMAEDPALRAMEPGERVHLVLDQLQRLFGGEAAQPIDYFERDWSSDPNTNEAETDLGIPLIDYGHALFSRPLMDGRLVWAGAETAHTGGGHMEGAVRSGRRAAEDVLSILSEPRSRIADDPGS